METAENLSASFERTHWLVNKFAEDMTHEESLATPSFATNCFNWVLGHLVVNRDRALLRLGMAPQLDEMTTAVYQTGSEAVSAETATDLDDLLGAFNRAQADIGAALELISAEDLATVVDPDSGATLGATLAGLHWHETYHTGQLEVLRQVAVTRPSFP